MDRTQPILPLRPGLPQRQTHDYERHGTTTLFAALNVAAGKIIAQCQPRHRWFAEITRKRIRRGTFRSVRDRVQAIQDYIRENNKNPLPFQWVASANTIVRKVRKYKQTLETGD